MRSFVLPLLGCTALFFSTAAPASQKPCRDGDGKIIACSKPTPKSVPPQRCKDAKGRFVACKPGTPPGGHR
jgi:hypothetical protein